MTGPEYPEADYRCACGWRLPNCVETREISNEAKLAEASKLNANTAIGFAMLPTNMLGKLREEFATLIECPECGELHSFMSHPDLDEPPVRTVS